MTSRHTRSPFRLTFLSSLAASCGALALASASAFAQLDWRDRTPPMGGPVPRSSHALAYDPVRGTTVLFGGIDNIGQVLGDTWEWDGLAWSAVTPATSSPSPRYGHAMAYDRTRGRAVLFGGEDGASTFADTWEWDGVDWIPASPATSSPPARARHAMAHDGARGVTVVFGGSADQGLTYLGDTWEWDGSDWSSPPVASPPAPRDGAAMGYLPGRGRLVLYGGLRLNDPMGPVVLDETWEFDGAAWTQLSPSLTPNAILGYAGAIDVARDRLVLAGFAEGFGGPLFVAYEFDGAEWAPLDFRTIPSPRFAHALAYDPVRRQVVMHGGTDGFSAIGETWEYGFAPVFVASVIPATGSESGNDFVTIRGGGFTTTEDTVVLFDGAPAAMVVVDDGQDLITARTPAGAGSATVVVQNGNGDGVLERGFTYIAPSLAARLGNVNVRLGDRENVLTVNGLFGDADTRMVQFAPEDPFTVDMAVPSSRAMSTYVLYGWVGNPGESGVTEQRFDIGTTVFPTPLSGGAKQPKVIWKNVPGHDRLLGSPNRPSTPAPSNVLTSPFGTLRVITFALQGFVRDGGSRIPEGFSVTNAVIVRTQ